MSIAPTHSTPHAPIRLKVVRERGRNTLAGKRRDHTRAGLSVLRIFIQKNTRAK